MIQKILNWFALVGALIATTILFSIKFTLAFLLYCLGSLNEIVCKLFEIAKAVIFAIENDHKEDKK